MAKQNVFDIVKDYATSLSGLSGAPKTKDFPSHMLSGRITPKTKRLLSSRLFKAARAVTRWFSRISSRAYGSTALSFGLVTLFLYFLGLSNDPSIATPILGAVISIVSIPFLLFDKPLSLLFQDFAITDFIFFEFFCIKRLNKMETTQRFPAIISYALGIITAAAGYFIPTWIIVCAIAGLTFFCVTMLSPEFAFFLSFIFLPYAGYIPYSSQILILMVSISAFSFARKVIFGKRVMYFERYDILICIMMLFVFISGAFVNEKSSFKEAIEFILLILGYSLASNVIANRRLADRAIHSIVISSLVPSVISIVYLLIALANTNISSVSDLFNCSVFTSNGACAVFMIVSIFYSAGMLIQSQGVRRLFYALIALLDLICLLISGELIAVFALLLGAAAFVTLKYPKLSAWVLILFPTIPYFLAFLPNPVLDVVFSIIPSLNTGHNVLILWEKSLSVLLNNIFFGIGIGSEAFVDEFAKYGIGNFNNSSNLFIEIAVEAGIFALICFIILLLVRIFHRAGYHFYVKNSELNVLAPVSTLCALSLVAYGAFSYIFADHTSYYLFWCVFGIGSAALRVAKKETDDRMLYYEDTRAAYSSAIDVNLL